MIPRMDDKPTPSATVLVVDDEPRNLEVITHFLEAEKFRVITAEDGETALALVTETPPDLVLLDVVMPQMDGFEVCRRLKEHPETLFIPVIILTALRGVSERIKGASVGADDFLSKPFDHVEMVTRVKSLVRVKRLHDQLQSSNEELERRVVVRTAELQHALAALQELDRLKSDFIANVSHELRTPLLHVKGYVDLLADGAMGALTSQQKEGLNIAQEAIEQLERVVEDIVDFSQVHERELLLEIVPLPDLCLSVVQTIRPLATRRGIDVSLVLPKDLPPVQADPMALARILRHLVDNAVKFGPAKGQVQVSARPNNGSQVRIAVSDRGPGIPPEQLSRIFDVFYQMDGSTTRRAGGLGLGLSLVKKLVEAHGSRICVDSQVGEGSTFYFDLPRATM